MASLLTIDSRLAAKFPVILCGGGIPGSRLEMYIKCTLDATPSLNSGQLTHAEARSVACGRHRARHAPNRIAMSAPNIVRSALSVNSASRAACKVEVLRLAAPMTDYYTPYKQFMKIKVTTTQRDDRFRFEVSVTNRSVDPPRVTTLPGTGEYESEWLAQDAGRTYGMHAIDGKLDGIDSWKL